MAPSQSFHMWKLAFNPQAPDKSFKQEDDLIWIPEKMKCLQNLATCTACNLWYVSLLCAAPIVNHQLVDCYCHVMSLSFSYSHTYIYIYIYSHVSWSKWWYRCPDSWKTLENAGKSLAHHIPSSAPHCIDAHASEQCQGCPCGQHHIYCTYTHVALDDLQGEVGSDKCWGYFTHW